MDALWQWLQGLEWNRLVPELLGKGLGFLAGFAASWFLLFRRRLREIHRFQQGDSDDMLFQMHVLHPVEASDEVVLIFRNVGPRTTVNQMYDNAAARDVVKNLAEHTTLSSPILQTAGREGYEVLNDAVGYIAGHLATTPFARDIWLFAMTCEDRQVVRKKCIRNFLIRPADLAKFEDWAWCVRRVRVEKPWHWFRVVALHQIAQQWRQQRDLAARRADKATDMPLVDDQAHHDRIRELSLGLNTDELPIGSPRPVEWSGLIKELRGLGLKLAMPEARVE